MVTISLFFKNAWRRMKNHPTVSFLCGGGFLLVVLSELLIFLALRGRDEPLVIHYTRNGIDQFGTFSQIIAYGTVAGAMTLINLALALELEERDWFWGKVVGVTTLILAILLFVAFQAIITVN